MQQGRADDALKLWTVLLERCPTHGDALHGLVGVHLEAGRTAEARRTCVDGLQKAPMHSYLLAQAARDASYYPAPTAPNPPNSAPRVDFQKPDCDAYQINISNGQDGEHVKKATTVYRTRSSLLCAQECIWAVSTAEAHARKIGGWSTARHYGAPTTDIALHESPELLCWFNGVLRDRVIPLLQSLYGHDLSFHCNDAFLVRYDAESGQRHLPVHTDQSTHSLTLALNGGSDFTGGGTYFCDLGHSLSVASGQALLFEGGLLRHGGDPVLQGVRYIIAAFLFAEKMAKCQEILENTNSTVEVERSTKRPRQAQGVFVKWW